jgi:hypothetical protein
MLSDVLATRFARWSPVHGPARDVPVALEWNIVPVECQAEWSEDDGRQRGMSSGIGASEARDDLG